MILSHVVEGMSIIKKYATDENCVAAEHDTLYCGSTDLPLTPDDEARMQEMGWLKDEDTSSWLAFV